MVVDAASGKQIGEIPNTEGVHGIALVAEMGKGFTSNGRENTATVFDLKSLKESDVDWKEFLYGKPDRPFDPLAVGCTELAAPFRITCPASFPESN